MQDEYRRSGGIYPDPNDARYTPFIGKNVDEQYPEQRYLEFAQARKEMRHISLKENGIEPSGT
jgi:hypothetical protein